MNLNADLICLDKANNAVAHFSHNPFLSQIPKEVFTDVHDIRAAGVPYECKGSTAYLKIKMRVVRAQTNVGVWAIVLYGHPA